ILANYQSSKPEEKKLAVDAANNYVKSISVCPPNYDGEFVDWLKKKIPEWEKGIDPTRSADGCDHAELAALETTIRNNYQSTKPEEKKLAIEAANKYLEKACSGDRDFDEWLVKKLPDWQKSISPTPAPATMQTYDAELAKKLGADERGMKMYVLC